LPSNLQNAQLVNSFKTNLKTHLFNLAYNSFTQWGISRCFLGSSPGRETNSCRFPGQTDSLPACASCYLIRTLPPNTKFPQYFWEFPFEILHSNSGIWRYGCETKVQYMFLSIGLKMTRRGHIIKLMLTCLLCLVSYTSLTRDSDT
jgi:hypothetical protein